MWHLLPALECPVYPERTATPHLLGGGVEVGGNRDTISLLQPGTVVGYFVGTLLVIVLVTA